MSMSSWHTMRSYTRDRSITSQRLKPGSVRRIASYARPYRGSLALFLTITVLDAVVMVAVFGTMAADVLHIKFGVPYEASTTLFAVVLAAATPRPAGAQQAGASQTPLVRPAALPPRQANYAWDADLLRASFSYRDVLADPELVKKLSSGLPTVIVMRAYVYREGQDTPVALAARVCRVFLFARHIYIQILFSKL